MTTMIRMTETTGTMISARARILGWMLLLVGLALLVSVAATRIILVDRLDDRLDLELEQEAAKLRAFAVTAVDPATGRPYREVDALLARHLQRNLPDRHETFFSLVQGVPDRRSPGPTAPARLDDDRAFVTKATRADRPFHGTAETSVGQVRYAVLPVRLSSDPRPGALVVVEFRDVERAEVDQLVRVLGGVGVVALLLAAVAGWLVAGRVLAPVRLVRQTAERISATDLSRRIQVEGDDDLAALARTFNTMLDRLESAFASQRNFLDDAGHELRTPITIVRGHLELMGDDPADRAETVALVTDELDRMARIVDDLMVLARAGRPDFLAPGEVLVADLVLDTVARARVLGDRQWVVGAAPDVLLIADGQRLVQALLQLATNAVQHTGPGDRIEVGAVVEPAGVGTAQAGTAPAGTVRLRVADSGVGVDPADTARIFDRFARGDGGGRSGRSGGAGLGLAIVRAIAEAHGGGVEVAGTPGGGATFTLVLPARLAEPAPDVEEVPL